MVRPKQNLPPDSQQWARSIQDDVDRLLASGERKDQTQDNTLAGLANSLSNLGKLVTTLSEQQAQVSQAVSDLSAQQSYLSSLKSRNAATGSWQTTSFSVDSTWHWDGPVAAINNLSVPTGKVRLFVRASNAVASASSSSLLRVGLSYSISGVISVGDNITYIGAEQGSSTSAPIVHIGTVEMTPGVYNFAAYRGYYCANAAATRAFVANTALIVEVVNND